MHESDGMHVDEGVLLALIDGETTSGDDRAHVDACEDCAARLDELRFAARRVAASLADLDAPSPLSEMPDGLRQAVADAPTPIGRPLARRGRVGGRSVAAAAGLILVLAAGAYAIPGSPVRTFVDGSVAAIGDLFGGDAGPVDPGPSQVAVEPVDGRVLVTVLDASEDLRVTIRTGEAARATVSARNARFGVEAGEIRVTDAAGDLAVELPAGTAGVVTVNGTEVARSSAEGLVRLPGADRVPAAIVVQTSG